ncbi:BnaCnng61900D [Brassica napus]|uniref:BnaCnng61900D protein n=1 Tax=Brassica napus TaxID=3708 RepID=A0A078JUD0_BRANA|nr:BnaCnng61900D [Brassica napus]
MIYKSFEFPQSLYLYPQLETLILEKLSLVDIPPNVSLIGLKKLNLLSVRFSNDDTYTNVMVFTIDVPTLKCLSIDNTSGESRPEGVHGFVINAPSLRCFSIKDTFSNYVRFGDMPELVKASVNIICDQPILTAREKVQSTSSKI